MQLVELRLADAIDHDPFDGAAVEFRILAGVLTAPKRRKRLAWRRRKVATLGHFSAVARFARDAALSLFAGAACGTAVAGFLMAAAPVVAHLGGIA